MRLLVLIGLTLAMASGVQAKKRKKKWGPAGCGLGSSIFAGKKGTMYNVLAATTNGSSGNQTFGMTSGTSGCDGSNRAKIYALNFIEDNKSNLANDVAKGGGETLDAYLVLINKKDSNVQALQSQFDKIFQTNESEAIYEAIESVLNS